LKIAKVIVQLEMRPRQLKVTVGKGDPGEIPVTLESKVKVRVVGVPVLAKSILTL